MAVNYVGMNEAVKMNYAELKKIVTAAAREARKRADRIFKSEQIFGSDSPAIRKAQSSKPRGQSSLFESRGKNRNQLLREYRRIKDFIEDPTSTVKGTQAFYKKITEKVQEQFKKLDEETSGETAEDKKSWSTNDTRKMFKIFTRLQQENPWVNDLLFKYHVLEMISSNIKGNPNMSMDDLFTKAEGMLDDVYVKVMNQYAQGWKQSGNAGDENASVDDDYMDVDDFEEWDDLI